MAGKNKGNHPTTSQIVRYKDMSEKDKMKCSVYFKERVTDDERARFNMAHFFFNRTHKRTFADFFVVLQIFS